MSSAIVNIVIGLVLVVMGGSGKFRLLWFSSRALMLAGVVVAAWGVIRLVQAVARR